MRAHPRRFVRFFSLISNLITKYRINRDDTTTTTSATISITGGAIIVTVIIGGKEIDETI